MRISLPSTLIRIVLVFTWCIYPLLVFLIVFLARKNYRINYGFSYMFHFILHVYKAAGEDRETAHAAARQWSSIIAYDTYATGNKIYLMKYWVPAVLAAGAINRTAQVYLPSMRPSLARDLLGTIVVVIFSGLLFWLKQQFTIVYGAVEAAFAVGSCILSLQRLGDVFDATVVIGLFGSIYLMIRAADNVSKGLDQWRSKRRGVLTTIKKLKKMEEVRRYRVWFAAIVRATGELLLVQTEVRYGKHLVIAKPPLFRESQYTGILFVDGDAEDLWKKENPKTQQGTFFGSQLKMVSGSVRLFINPDPQNLVDLAPRPATEIPTQS
jgi:hypothetical protein